MTENSASVGVPCESVAGERRVALVPEIVRRIVATGVRVVVEPGAGAQAMIPDAAFVAAGASVDAEGAWHADVVVKVSPPSMKVRYCFSSPATWAATWLGGPFLSAWTNAFMAGSPRRLGTELKVCPAMFQNVLTLRGTDSTVKGFICTGLYIHFLRWKCIQVIRYNG